MYYTNTINIRIIQYTRRLWCIDQIYNGYIITGEAADLPPARALLELVHFCDRVEVGDGGRSGREVLLLIEHAVGVRVRDHDGCGRGGDSRISDQLVLMPS